jgi:hypothetical protein
MQKIENILENKPDAEVSEFESNLLLATDGRQPTYGRPPLDPYGKLTFA